MPHQSAWMAASAWRRVNWIASGSSTKSPRLRARRAKRSCKSSGAASRWNRSGTAHPSPKPTVPPSWSSWRRWRALPPACRGGSRRGADPGTRPHLFPCRPARRHEGIRPWRRRLHCQHWPHRRRYAAPGRRLCTGDRTASRRLRRRGRVAGRRTGAPRDPHPAPRRATDGGRLKISSQSGEYRLS